VRYIVKAISRTLGNLTGRRAARLDRLRGERDLRTCKTFEMVARRLARCAPTDGERKAWKTAAERGEMGRVWYGSSWFRSSDILL